MNSSELAQRVGINEVAESMMAFNTNYKDTGLFGVYAVANVSYHVYSMIDILQCICLLFKYKLLNTIQQVSANYI